MAASTFPGPKASRARAKSTALSTPPDSATTTLPQSTRRRRATSFFWSSMVIGARILIIFAAPFRLRGRGVAKNRPIVAFRVFRLPAVVPTAKLIALLLDKLERSPYNIHAFVGFL